jgi:hypothetical protein
MKPSKKFVVFPAVIFICATIIYGYRIFSKEDQRHRDLATCQDWYTSSYQGWKHWPNLTPAEKSELENLSSEIDRIVANACDCIYSKSDVFREQLVTKLFSAKTDSFVDILNLEMKKYQVECHIPKFFTWTASIEDIPSKGLIYKHSSGH